MGTPKVEFHRIDARDAAARLRAACFFVERLHEAGQRVYVRTSSPAETAELDDLLWTFTDDSFVPHAVWPAEASIIEVTPVLVGSAAAPDSHRDVLLNLATDAPPDFSSYARVCELVGGDEACVQAGRVRWRVYRDAGFPPELQSNDPPAESR